MLSNSIEFKITISVLQRYFKWYSALKHHLSRAVEELVHLISFPFIRNSQWLRPLLRSVSTDEAPSASPYSGLFCCTSSVLPGCSGLALFLQLSCKPPEGRGPATLSLLSYLAQMGHSVLAVP